MGRAIVLDSGPLGLLSNPTGTSGQEHAWAWVEQRVAAGDRVVIAEIADYEVRRELIRAGREGSVARLDHLAHYLDYIPLNTTAVRLAAELWAVARNAGHPTAHQHALDGDVLLAAQARQFGATEEEVVVATTNPSHLARYAPAAVWHEVG